METFTRFLYEFLSQFLSGLWTIVSGIGNGIKQIIKMSDLYLKSIKHLI